MPEGEKNEWKSKQEKDLELKNERHVVCNILIYDSSRGVDQ